MYINKFLAQVVLFLFTPLISCTLQEQYTNTISNISATGNQEDLWSSVVQTTYSILTQKAYTCFSLDKALPKALDALCQVDQYSRFLGPDEYAELKETTQGEFYGIGVLLAPKQKKEKHALILDCIFESPADKSNLQRYDKILSIDGQSVENLSVDDVARILKSTKRNSPVILSILRGTKTIFNVTLKRDTIQQESVTSFYFPRQNIGYCAIPLFTAHTTEQLRRALMHLIAKKPCGLIIDLRDNAGGLMQAAVDCAAFFLPHNTLVVSTQDRHKRVQEQFHTRFEQLVYAPITCIILVNTYTASAGEIFAGALQLYAQKSMGPTSNYNLSILVLGTRTHGKGSVQELIPVGNNCALKLTTGIYYLPGNSCVDGVGVTPDIPVKQKYKCLATKIAKKNKQDLQNYQKAQAHKIQADHQVQTAVNILNLLSATRSYTAERFITHAQLSSFVRNNFITHARTITVQSVTNEHKKAIRP